MTTRVLTTADVAALHGVTTETVRHWRRRGLLVPVVVATSASGDQWLFDEEVVRAFVRPPRHTFPRKESAPVDEMPDDGIGHIPAHYHGFGGRGRH